MDMLERIDQYWSKRVEEFSNARLNDLKSAQKDIWLEIIKEHLPNKKEIRVLDLGTGAGFYAFLTADLGCKVIGIDYSQAMIDQAKSNAELLAYKDITFKQMDAQNLEFEDGSLDFIISRNVTWTLPDPEKAYCEMCRVLAPGGRILNFDANYGQAFRAADEVGLSEEQRQWSRGPYQYPAQSTEMIRERNAIAKSIYVCDCIRPQWDMDILLRNGMEKITVDTDIGRRVYGEARMFGNSFNTAEDGKSPALPTSPLFMIVAEKSSRLSS